MGFFYNSSFILLTFSLSPNAFVSIFPNPIINGSAFISSKPDETAFDAVDVIWSVLKSPNLLESVGLDDSPELFDTCK